MSADWETIDWQALERLRQVFLEGAAGAEDYWQSQSDLDSYDLTFGRRIAWKWDYVLTQLKACGWSPSGGAVCDWGCGTGVAGRSFLGAFGAAAADELLLWDRSDLATRFAQRAIRAAHPGLRVRIAPPTRVDTWLLSHVLSELTPADLGALLVRVAEAQAVIWVEAGTHAASRSLVQVRERLRSAFRVVAPCTHQAACGMLTPGNERHWCHHFASPPSEVFHDARWARFGDLLGIDLRSLPVSFLVLDRRPPSPYPPGTVRVIGRPRIDKAHVLLFGCDADGVRARRLSRRVSPRQYRRLKKVKGAVPPFWRCVGDEMFEDGGDFR